MKHATALFVTLIIVGLPMVASPCSVASSFYHDFEFLEEPPDAPPPLAPTVTVASITRGTGPQSEGCGQSANSCDDLGFLTLEITGLAEGAGMRFEVRGEPPAGVDLPSGVSTVLSTSPTLTWIDDATDAQEPVDFEFRAFAIDRWGQESDPTDWVVVSDPGRSGGLGGCSTTAGAGATLLPMLALLWAMRRRRRV